MKTLTTLSGVLLLLSAASLTSAQTPKYEVGGQMFAFHSKSIGFGWGMGGRFSYNVTRNIAIDTELNGFLDDEGGVVATQGFAGAKVGVRNKLVGVFVKARPGFMTNFAKPLPDYATTFNTEKLNKFAFDVGAVFEVYPSKHTTFRVDVGDVIIPFGNDPIVANGPQRLGTTHTFQYSLGFGLRF
jgi:Outer membrane protein beta-barrel domain